MYTCSVDSCAPVTVLYPVYTVNCVLCTYRVLDKPGLVPAGVGQEEVLHLLCPGQVQELQDGPDGQEGHIG